MTHIGKPERVIEAWPIELPVPKQIPEEEPEKSVPKKVEPEKVGVSG